MGPGPDQIPFLMRICRQIKLLVQIRAQSLIRELHQGQKDLVSFFQLQHFYFISCWANL